MADTAPGYWGPLLTLPGEAAEKIARDARHYAAIEVEKKVDTYQNWPEICGLAVSMVL